MKKTAALLSAAVVVSSAGFARAAKSAPARLPGCASPLMRSIFRNVVPVVSRGSVEPRLLVTGDNAADARVYIQGHAIFGEVARLIAGAKREAVFQTYVWQDGSQATQAILGGIAALNRRLKAEGRPVSAGPVRVRLLVDASDVGFGSKPIGEELPVLQKRIDALKLDKSLVRVDIAAHDHAAFGVLHSKSLIVDGRRAMVMGANAEKTHDLPTPWFDAGYRVEGAVAAALREDFAASWNQATTWTCGTHGVPGGIFPLCMGHTSRLPPLAAAPLRGGACLPMMVVATKLITDPFSNRTDNPADRALLGGFAAASRVIRAQTPDLNDDAVRAALLHALVRRRTDVELILSKGFNDSSENEPGQGGDNVKNVALLYKALRAAGVKDPCSRLKTRWYSFDGRKPVVGNGPRASHAKYYSFDGQVVVVGSSNLDTQSWNFSKETDVVVDNRAITASWDGQVFLKDFARAIPVEQCSGAKVAAK